MTLFYNKPSAVIEETDAQWRARKEAQKEQDTRVRGYLEYVKRDIEPWPNATAMLSWFFAMRGHMSSVPAIDPAAETIQGLRVDKDERHWRIGSVEQALGALVGAQGSHLGVTLLWLHLAPRRLRREFTRRGVTVREWVDPIPLDELFRYTGAYAELSRRAAIQLYWSSLAAVEEFAYARKWITARSKRKPKKEQVYRRGEE